MKKTVIRKPSASFVLIVSLVILLTGLCLLADALEVQYGWRRDHSFNAVTTQSTPCISMRSIQEALRTRRCWNS